ncbi:low-density lipoprotein receptor-related protein 3 isoform X1 [Danio rerio]|uniref:Low-density lipoprotein receptor-related protein 3 isoform X1 n=1 Tax=Danio rerio TaxID=7955 RepID=A0AC58FX49_DANRE
MNIYVETASVFHVPGAVMDWMNVEIIQMRGTVSPHQRPPGRACVHQAPYNALMCSLPAACQGLCAVTGPGTVLTDLMRPAARTHPVENAWSTSMGHLLPLISSVRTGAPAQIFTARGSWTQNPIIHQGSPQRNEPPTYPAYVLHCRCPSSCNLDPKPLVLQVDLQLGVGDSVRVYDGLGEQAERLLQSLSHHNNHRRALLESSQGQMSIFYHAKPHSPGHGFNATYQVKGYCFPGEHPCGTDEGCYSDLQRCDGYWHCPGGRDEEACPLCQPGEYPCEGGSGACYSASERCNNQKKCPDGSDEKNCFDCQPGNFHCGTNLCIFETWRCDGQEDCMDGSDERDCLASVPRKVITAALIGSLVCGLLLVIALGCAFKLYSLRTREYRAFETQMTRLEAEFVQREAPPSYGQLIAQGLIPPVDDFPVYNPTQASVLQNLRSAMRRQIRRHSSRRSSSRRRLGRLWNRLFHRGSRVRGQIPLLTPPGHTHANTYPELNLHSYNTADNSVRESPETTGQTPPSCSAVALGLALQAQNDALCLPDRESPASPLSLPSPNSLHSTSDTLEDEDDEDDRSSAGKQGILAKHKDADSSPGPSERPKRSASRSRSSRRLVQELAAELRGVSLLRYTSVGISPLSSPESPTSSSGQSEEQRSCPAFRKAHKDKDDRGHSRESSGVEDVPGDSVRLCGLTASEEEEDDDALLVH